MIKQITQQIAQFIKSDNQVNKITILNQLFTKNMLAFHSFIFNLNQSNIKILKQFSKNFNIIFQQTSKIAIFNQQNYLNTHKLDFRQSDFSQQRYRKQQEQLQKFLNNRVPIQLQQTQKYNHHQLFQKLLKQFQSIGNNAQQVIQVSSKITQYNHNNQQNIEIAIQNIQKYQDLANQTLTKNVKNKISQIQNKYEDNLSKKGVKIIHKKSASIQTIIDLSEYDKKMNKLVQFETKWIKMKEQHTDLLRIIRKKQREINQYKIQIMHLTINKINMQVQISKLSKINNSTNLQPQNTIQQIQNKIVSKYQQMLNFYANQQLQKNYQPQKIQIDNQKKNMLTLKSVLQICLLPIKKNIASKSTINPLLLTQSQNAEKRLVEMLSISLRDKKIYELQRELKQLQFIRYEVNPIIDEMKQQKIIKRQQIMRCNVQKSCVYKVCYQKCMQTQNLEDIGQKNEIKKDKQVKQKNKKNLMRDIKKQVDVNIQVDKNNLNNINNNIKNKIQSLNPNSEEKNNTIIKNSIKQSISKPSKSIQKQSNYYSVKPKQNTQNTTQSNIIQKSDSKSFYKTKQNLSFYQSVSKQNLSILKNTPLNKKYIKINSIKQQFNQISDKEKKSQLNKQIIQSDSIRQKHTISTYALSQKQKNSSKKIQYKKLEFPKLGNSKILQNKQLTDLNNQNFQIQIQKNQKIFQLQSQQIYQKINTFAHEAFHLLDGKKNKKQIQNYLSRFQSLHKRCGLNCSHLQKVYKLIQPLNLKKRYLVLPKQDL